MKGFSKTVLILLFALGFIVRLYRFDGPVADWHSFRQGDTNAVSQIFAQDGINLLEPRYFDISNVQSGFDNPHGYRFVEFPIYNALQAGLFNIFGTLTLVEWGRLITIFATLSGAFAVYLIIKKHISEVAGLFSAFFYLFLPFSIYYGRTILPDPSMAASILAGTYFFDAWLNQKANSKKQIAKTYLILNTIHFMLAILFSTLAFLLKPYALFFTLPMLYLTFRKFGFSFLKNWKLWIFLIVTIAPLVFWRLWISHHPEGIPVSAWLFNGNGIRFKPSFFRWIFYDRITRLILGYVGLVFLGLGIYSLKKLKNYGLIVSFILSSLIYLSVIATGNVQHDYYQILIIPTISMICGVGAAHLYEKFSKNQFLKFQVLVLAVLTILIGWLQVKDYFNINDWGMVNAAAEANKVLPKDAIVIAPGDGSTTFLNLIGRPGWPIFESPIEKLIDRGANYLVIANPTKSDFDGFGKKYKVVDASSVYLILKLK